MNPVPRIVKPETTLLERRRLSVRLAPKLVAIGLCALGLACDRAEDGAETAASSVEIPRAAFDAVRAALDRYELARSLLALDAPESLAGVAEAATQLASDLRTAHGAWPASDVALVAELDEAATASAGLGEHAAAGDVAASRVAFGEVSRHLLPVVAADARLRDGRFVFECPMTKTFPRWLQSSENVSNPYMGAGMASCGARAAWPEAAANTAGGTS
jgi:hypothetical protein